MSKAQQREILLIAETMAVEGGQAVDILIGLEHKARLEYTGKHRPGYTERGDVLTIDTQAGHWEA